MASMVLKRSVNKLFSYSPFTFSGVGICHMAQAVEGDTQVSLEKVDEWSYWRITEMAERASSRREVFHTDFIPPTVLKGSVMSLKFLRLKTFAQGGYHEAERCRLSFGHPELLTTVPNIVAALSISGDFSFQPCSPRDFLGSILGTGIAREKVGDIVLLGEKGAHVYVVPEVADFLTMSLDKVGNVPVTCKKKRLFALENESPRIKIFRTVVASTRVDSIASAGFKISRAKLAGLISDGDVRVNSVKVKKNNTTIKIGDMITLSGKGSLKIELIEEVVKKTYYGESVVEFAVEFVRYL